jgi:hypothetical protein
MKKHRRLIPRPPLGKTRKGKRPQRRYQFIGAKRIFVGLVQSVLMGAFTVWAIRRYAGPVPGNLVPLAAALVTFCNMSCALRSAAREAYEAGEVSQRARAGSPP